MDWAEARRYAPAQPDGWKRLRALLDLPEWNMQTAVFVVAGLDPATEWEDPDAPLVWLPDGLLPEWHGLMHEQVQRRAERALGAADTKMSGVPVPLMPPIQWLFEAMRRKRVHPHWADEPYRHPGIVPPWVPAARKRPPFELLIPPVLYPQSDSAKQKHAGQPSARLRAIVRRMWDAWTLDKEGIHRDKAAFIADVLRVLDRDASDAHANEGSIRNMIYGWERELFCPYGVTDSEDATLSRGYGPHAIMEPVKKTTKRRIPE